MKKILLTLVCVMCISSTVFAANVNVQLNGKIVDFTDEAGNKVEAQTINSRTMVPMRKIFELLGASIEWNAGTKTVTATKDGTVIKLQINNENAEVIKSGKSEKIKLDSKPIILNNRTMVPLRFISESLDKQVGWDSLNQTAVIIDYDYFLEKIKKETPTLYRAITEMPSSSANIQVTRSYSDLSNSANNTISKVEAQVAQINDNEQNITVNISGNSLLFKEIADEGWNNFNLNVKYNNDGVTYTTSSPVFSKMLNSTGQTYKELGLAGRYNMSVPELIKDMLNIDENKITVSTFKVIRDEFDNLLKLFSFSESNGKAVVKANGINYSNANLSYIDYTKFDNIIVENEFIQVYNLINKLSFNYDVKMDELLYDISNIDFELTSQEQDGGLNTVITIKLSNEYNEMFTYVVKIYKK